MGIQAFRDRPIEIIDEMIEHGLCKVLRDKGIQPRDFFKALANNTHLDEHFTRTQQWRSEWLVEEIMDIADNDFDYQRGRNRIEARKWYASKVKPSKYGDRLNLDVTQTLDIRGALQDARQRVLKPLTLNALPCKQARHVETIDDLIG